MTAVRVAKTPVEVWHQDEAPAANAARFGEPASSPKRRSRLRLGTLTCVWADKGSRPAALRDQRRQSADLFGAVCAAAEQRSQRDRGVGAALVLPHANADAMSLHLAEISRRVAEGAHAVVVLDGAGWHQTGGRLRVPGNISLLRLPPHSPELNPQELNPQELNPQELNPQENVRQSLRQNQLPRRVLADYGAIVAACCTARNALMAMPNRIRSIATRAWTRTVVA